MQTILEKLNIKSVNFGTSTGLNAWSSGEELLASFSPVDNQLIAEVTKTTFQDYQQVVEKANDAFKTWRNIPAPRRGEIVRQMGMAFREYKSELGKLVSYEMGKVYKKV